MPGIKFPKFYKSIDGIIFFDLLVSLIFSQPMDINCFNQLNFFEKLSYTCGQGKILRHKANAKSSYNLYQVKNFYVEIECAKNVHRITNIRIPDEAEVALTLNASLT